jgi:hypothetical protein
LFPHDFFVHLREPADRAKQLKKYKHGCLKNLKQFNGLRGVRTYS